ncbi:MAG: hypothetical protein ACJATF_002196 [Flavobacteriales bacterium]
MNRTIDHIVYTVSNLEEAINDFEKSLGVRPIIGGYHKTQGTKNALLNLSNGCYLELLAVDESNTEIPPPRWMGVDVLTKNQITRWALKSDILKIDSRTLQQYNSEMGKTTGGSRNTEAGSLLKWKMILPLAKPEVEIVPFMVDWSQSETHPAEALADSDCSLVELYVMHPEPEIFDRIFKELGIGIKLERGEVVELKMRIRSPLGVVDL